MGQAKEWAAENGVELVRKKVKKVKKVKKGKNKCTNQITKNKAKNKAENKAKKAVSKLVQLVDQTDENGSQIAQLAQRPDIKAGISFVALLQASGLALSNVIFLSAFAHCLYWEAPIIFFSALVLREGLATCLPFGVALREGNLYEPVFRGYSRIHTK